MGVYVLQGLDYLYTLGYPMQSRVTWNLTETFGQQGSMYPSVEDSNRHFATRQREALGHIGHCMRYGRP